MYADRKSLPLERVTVTLKHSKIHAEDCAECETKAGMLDQIDRTIAMEGALDAEQRKKLMEIADKCPVHRTLTSEIRIVTARRLTVSDRFNVRKWHRSLKKMLKQGQALFGSQSFGAHRMARG